MARAVSGRELLARLRAVLRRPQQILPAVIAVGNVRFDTANRQVWIGGAPVRFPRSELTLLEHLMTRQGRVVARDVLEGSPYGLSQESCPNSIDVRISRVRRHLGGAGATVEIQTVRGVGYVLCPARDGAREAAVA